MGIKILRQFGNQDNPAYATLAIRLLLLAGIFVSFVFYFYFAASNNNAGFSFSDSVRYLFMADYFSGATDALTVQTVQISIYPPLFPLMLALLGAGTENIATAHVVTSATLTLACAACFWWLSEEHLTLNERLVIILMLLVLPGIFFHSMKIASEFLFLALALSALAAMKKSSPSNHWIVAAALMVGLSIATRTIGIALLPCLFLACRRLGYRKLIMSVVLSLTPYLSWRLFRESSITAKSYLDMFSFYLEQFSLLEIIHNLVSQLESMLHYWIRIFDPLYPTHVAVIHVLLLTAASTVFMLRLAKLKSESVLLLFYLGIITIWPFPHELERFMIVLVPIIFFYCLLAVEYITTKFHLLAIGEILKTAVFVVILFSTLPTLFFVQHRFSLPAPKELSGHKFLPTWYTKINHEATIFRAQQIEGMYKMMREINKYVGEDECVYTTMADLVAMYSKRKAMYLPFDMYKNAESGYGYDINSLDQCNYILMLDVSVVQVPQYERMYPIWAINSQLDPILLSSHTYKGDEQITAAFAEIVR